MRCIYSPYLPCTLLLYLYILFINNLSLNYKEKIKNIIYIYSSYRGEFANWVYVYVYIIIGTCEKGD